jgi:aldehyde:ferredoxin oxidoreductase
VRNFQDGQWTPDQVTGIDAKTFAESPYRQRMDGCYACSVRCKKRAKDEAMGVEPRYGGPEYETLGATGTNLQVDDLPIFVDQPALESGRHRQRVSGATVAWATECHSAPADGRGHGGIPLLRGDGATVLKPIDLVAREGALGDLLADGALAAPGAPRAERAVRRARQGLEVAMHDRASDQRW